MWILFLESIWTQLWSGYLWLVEKKWWIHIKVIVYHSHLTTSSNYGKSCGLRRATKLWWEPHMPLCGKQIPLPEEWGDVNLASFCLILVNEVNIQGQKTLEESKFDQNHHFESFKAITLTYIRILRVNKMTSWRNTRDRLYLNCIFSSDHSQHHIIYDTNTYIFLFTIDVSLFCRVHSNIYIYIYIYR